MLSGYQTLRSNTYDAIIALLARCLEVQLAQHIHLHCIFVQVYQGYRVEVSVRMSCLAWPALDEDSLSGTESNRPITHTFCMLSQEASIWSSNHVMADLQLQCIMGPLTVPSHMSPSHIWHT